MTGIHISLLLCSFLVKITAYGGAPPGHQVCRVGSKGSAWTRYDFLRQAPLKSVAVAAVIFPTAAAHASSTADRDWADAKKQLATNSKPKTMVPLVDDGVVKKAEKAVKKQTRVLEREMKAVAYDAKSATKAAGKELKFASKDPSLYAQKTTKKVERAAQKEIKSVTRDAKKLIKRVEKEAKGLGF